MALRDKLRERVQPHLEPGEEVQEVFLSQTGPSPYWAILTYLIFFAVTRQIVAVTDRRIAVFRAGALSGTSPKELEGSLPRTTLIGPVSGLWGTSNLLGRKTFIHKRFHADVERADRWAMQLGGAPPVGGLSTPGGPQPGGPPPGGPAAPPW